MLQGVEGTGRMVMGAAIRLRLHRRRPRRCTEDGRAQGTRMDGFQKGDWKGFAKARSRPRSEAHPANTKVGSQGAQNVGRANTVKPHPRHGGDTIRSPCTRVGRRET